MHIRIKCFQILQFRICILKNISQTRFWALPSMRWVEDEVSWFSLYFSLWFLSLVNLQEKWCCMKIRSKIGSFISILLLVPWKKSGRAINDLSPQRYQFVFTVLYISHSDMAVSWPSFSFRSSVSLAFLLMVSLKNFWSISQLSEVTFRKDLDLLPYFLESSLKHNELFCFRDLR